MTSRGKKKHISRLCFRESSFGAAPCRAKASFNEPQRGWCSLYPSWPLRSSFFAVPGRNKYRRATPANYCRTTARLPLRLSPSLFLSLCPDEKSQCANIRYDRSFIVTPSPSASNHPPTPARSRVLGNP